MPGSRTSIVSGNYVRETSVKRRNKIVQEITRNVANVFSFYAIIAIEHGFSMHLHSPGPLGGVENRGLRIIPIMSCFVKTILTRTQMRVIRFLLRSLHIYSARQQLFL